jgi:hypothetical protein
VKRPYEAGEEKGGQKKRFPENDKEGGREKKDRCPKDKKDANTEDHGGLSKNFPTGGYDGSR